MFVDKVTVRVKAGDGGDGLVSWRHEKFIDRGGPDGGDGGDGGDVILEATSNLNSLSNFRHKQKLEAGDGEDGRKAKQHGKSGHDLLVKVPIGTVVIEEGKAVGEVVKNGAQLVIAKGGRGGFGNAHFISSKRRAPKLAEKGEPGDNSELQLELKLIADVGLVGLPNAGKSTLLSVISNAHPEIANYPFTTLAPNLGVADIGTNSLLVADIPGLIEGASQGKGLGDEFLRHIERTAVLIHLIDAYSEDVAGDYKTIMKELKNYEIDLTKRPMIVALTKIEGLDDEIVADQLKKLQKVAKTKDTMAISAQAKIGLNELLKTAQKAVASYRKTKAAKPHADVPHMAIHTIPMGDKWTVSKQDDHFKVRGSKVERFARQTDFDNPHGVDRLKAIMRKMGILHELERQGIKPGDKVHIGSHVMEY